MFGTHKKSKKVFLDGIFQHSSNVSTTLGGSRAGKMNNNRDLLMSLLGGEDSDEEGEFDIEAFEPNLFEDKEEEEFDEITGEKKKKKKKKTKKVANVKIEPVITQGEAYADAPHPHLLRTPFSLLVIAPKGSGKTTTTINILKWYENYFDNRIAFSPTMIIDDNWKAAFLKGTIKPFARKNMFKNYNEAKLCKIWKAIKKENKGKENYNDKLKTMILFDDIVGQLPRTRDNSCYKIARNHRHYGVSNITISQEYNACAPVLRKNATGLLLYGTTDGAEIKTITEQQGGFIGKNRFFRMWAHCISKPFGFMFINKDTKDNHRYFCNFETELFPLDFSNERVKDMIEELKLAQGTAERNGQPKQEEEKKEDIEEEKPKKTKKGKNKKIDPKLIKAQKERDAFEAGVKITTDEVKVEIVNKKLQDSNDTIEKNGEKVIPDIKDSELHICKCKMSVIKDISNVCNNGLNLICNALDIEVEGDSKEDMIEALSKFSTKSLKRVLAREKKKLGSKDIK